MLAVYNIDIDTDIMKPTNSPTQGQRKARNTGLKLACGPLFPSANNFSWDGIGLYILFE